MTENDYMNYCLQKQGAREKLLFKEGIPACTVGGKMFGVLVKNQGSYGLILKGTSDLSQALRQKYTGIKIPKNFDDRYWNLVLFNSDIPKEEILFLIDLSYKIVHDSLSKRIQRDLSSQSKG